jgi:hypothetical protein
LIFFAKFEENPRYVVLNIYIFSKLFWQKIVPFCITIGENVIGHTEKNKEVYPSTCRVDLGTTKKSYWNPQLVVERNK